MGIHPTVLSLFTGYGGLEMGLHRAIGGTRTVCMVEREAFAISNLVAQMEAGALAPAPIWTDVSTFDGKPWRDRISVLVGGPPCQPFSTAGKRRHTDDERWIWADVARIVADVRPGVVFFENVPGLRKRGLGVMLRDLAAMGYDAEWGCFTASEAGAPHRRTRLFLLAYADREQLRQLRRGRSGQGGASAAQPQLAGEEVAFPPAPDDADGWRRWLGSGGAQPGVRGGAHAGGCKNRVHRIRLLGNGVVPVQAERAFRELSARVLDSV